ncbi:MAG TPA: VCBS repeat-containing protein, partial [Ohtaekwangia sp.]|nr:VCBS repeat-containing protein [Ohtaekwangia sp.]
INDGKGNFKDATDSRAPALRKFGFVRDAVWVDMNGDGKNDLVIAAEWSPITILLSKNGKLEPMKLENSGLEKSHGWWNTILPFDFDRDGDMDLMAGNLGLNARLRASENQPVKMFVSDFDGNDSTDQVLTHYINGKEYPFHTRDEMTRQMPYLKKRYLSYHRFAAATLQDMFSEDALAASEQYAAYTFASAYIENLGDGKFRIQPLPLAAQFSTVNALWIDDFDGDHHEDILVAGNFYSPNIQMGRYDASSGLLLKGDGRGGFKSVPPVHSGFRVRGEVRSLKRISAGGRQYYIAIRNNDTIVSFGPMYDQPRVVANRNR